MMLGLIKKVFIAVVSFRESLTSIVKAPDHINVYL